MPDTPIEALDSAATPGPLDRMATAKALVEITGSDEWMSTAHTDDVWRMLGDISATIDADRSALSDAKREIERAWEQVEVYRQTEGRMVAANMQSGQLMGELMVKLRNANAELTRLRAIETAARELSEIELIARRDDISAVTGRRLTAAWDKFTAALSPSTEEGKNDE